MEHVLNHPSVSYGTLDMCAFGMRDPNGYYYYKPTSLLHSFSEDTMAPVFKRCPNKPGGEKDRSCGPNSRHDHRLARSQHQHQPIEGHSPGHESRTKLAQIYPYRFCSRTKLAQIYPYRFCSTLIRSILPRGNAKSLQVSQTHLVIELLDECFNIEELQMFQKFVDRDEAPVYTNSSTCNSHSSQTTPYSKNSHLHQLFTSWIHV